MNHRNVNVNENANRFFVHFITPTYSEIPFKLTQSELRKKAEKIGKQLQFLNIKLFAICVVFFLYFVIFFACCVIHFFICLVTIYFELFVWILNCWPNTLKRSFYYELLNCVSVISDSVLYKTYTVHSFEATSWKQGVHSQEN